VTTHGSPVLLGLAPGADEGTDPWLGFLAELKARRLRAPLLTITDGAPGLINAVELAFPRSLRQRCLIHREAVKNQGVGVSVFAGAVEGVTGTRSSAAEW
jgi:transposase-like protein